MSKDRMLKKGDNVVMHTCGEAAFPKNFGKVWTCKTDEYITGEGKGLYEQRLVFLEGFSGSFATDYLQYIDLDLARSAPDTTALPSVAAADKGILTEEELNDWETDTRELLPAVSDYRIKRLIGAVREVTERNRNLVSENDELLAEVNSKKLALEAIGMIVTGEILSNNIDKHLYTVIGIVKHELEELNDNSTISNNATNQ